VGGGGLPLLGVGVGSLDAYGCGRVRVPRRPRLKKVCHRIDGDAKKKNRNAGKWAYSTLPPKIPSGRGDHCLC